MAIGDIDLVRTLRLIAATVAILVAVSLPLGYWLVVYSFEAEATANDAVAHAELVTQRINASPDLWRFEIPRLDLIVATRPVTVGLAEKHYILDERGAVLAQNPQIISPPILTRSAPLLDSGTVVGRFVTSRSLVPQLQNAALVALFGLVLASAVYLSLSVLPLRALRRMGVALDAEQAALRTSEERLRVLFNRASDGIMIVSSIGKLVAVNESFAQMHGYSVEEMLAMSLKDLDAPESSRLAPERLQSTFSGKPIFFEAEHYHKDGHIFPLEVSASLIVSDGETLIQAFHRDITERKRVDQALHESEVRFRGLTEMSSDFYWESDTEHRLMQRSWVDKKLRSVSVFGQGTPIGKRRWELPYLSPDEAGWRAHRSLLEARRAFRYFEFSRLSADGTERHISVSGDPVFDESGAFKGYRGVGTDITERKRLEQALRASAQELRLFADNVPTMTAAWDEHLRCRFANKRYCEFYGFTVDNILGKHLREVVGEEIYREVEGYFVQVLQGRPVTYQKTRKLPNGESGYLEVKLLPHSGDQGQVLGCFSVTTDITEHKLAQERIQQVAHHDSLTGLPNRLLFNDRLQQAINLAKRDARQFALLYLDLDRFKPVNDALGHTAGDELLQAVASRIQHEVRESDTVARIGGDEFTVILSNITKREEAEIVANKIIAAVAAPFQLGSQQQSVKIGASIGIAIYPTDGQDADALVNAADAAMYGAKQVGNSFRFYAA